jgi:hypothetical protein
LDFGFRPNQRSNLKIRSRCGGLNPSSLFTVLTKLKLPTATASDHRPSQRPVERSENWIEFVNAADNATELDDLRSSAQRGRLLVTNDDSETLWARIDNEIPWSSEANMKILPTPFYDVGSDTFQFNTVYGANSSADSLDRRECS